jgi:hypothetical protein
MNNEKAGLCKRTSSPAHFDSDDKVTRADQISWPLRSPSLLNCSEGCEGLIFRSENCLSARARMPGQSFLYSCQNSALARWSILKRLNLTVLFVAQSALDGFVETARLKIGRKPCVDGLRLILIEPRVQLFQLLRRERPYGAFDLLNSVQAQWPIP